MSHDSQKIDILNMPLHSSIELDSLSLEQIFELLVFTDQDIKEISIPSIDCYCTKCGMQTTFKSKNSDSKLLEELWRIYIGSIELYEDRYPFYTRIHEQESFTRSYYCPRAPKDTSHDLSFVFRASENKLIKIGQYPALADLENTHLLKYRRLHADVYKELNRAVGLFSHGIGVGSFVYLRRIIEKFVLQPELDKMIEKNEVTSDAVIVMDFKEKVRIAKNHLPEDLVSNTNVYSILSKGIHSLTEEECKQIFPPLLTLIELILDDKIEQIEKNEKRNRLRNELGNIAGSI